MKLSMGTKCVYLLLAALCGSYGDTSDNCTAPAFKDTHCGTRCGCHEYYPGNIVHVGDMVTMTPRLIGTNLTIRWWTTNVNPIVGNDGEYFLKNNDRTLIWHHAKTGSTVFFINATNSCGRSSKACYVMHTYCNKCLDCPRVDNPTDDSRHLYEHSNVTVANSITSDNMSSYLQWCFIGSDNQRDCCTCDNTVGVKSGTCSQPDWHLETSYGDNTEHCSYEIKCSLTIKNIGMKYDGGMFVGEAIFIFQPNETHLVSQTNITILTHDNYIPHIIVGSGTLVGVIIIIIVISLRVVIKARRRAKPYQRIQSSSSSSSFSPTTHPVSATQEDVDLDSVSVNTTDFGFGEDSASVHTSDFREEYCISVCTSDFGERYSQPVVETLV